MNENKSPLILRISLVIFIIVAFVYGICFFLFPGFFVSLTGQDPVYYGWFNWAGAMLIALAIGAILALPNPKNQGLLVTTFALVNLFIGLTLLYNWIAAGNERSWLTLLPALLNLAISGLLWWSRVKAKDFLRSISA